MRIDQTLQFAIRDRHGLWAGHIWRDLVFNEGDQQAVGGNVLVVVIIGRRVSSLRKVILETDIAGFELRGAVRCDRL